MPVEVVAPAAVSRAPSPGLPIAQNRAAACEQDFSQHQWRAAIDSCTSAFEGAPSAAVALRIAHASFSHGQTSSAGKWAEKAVALGSDDADAFVLIGHSERQAGHPRAARSAYRHYLQRAPHGWHVSRVRAALRALASRKSSSQAVSAAE
jgi:Flp pilus assembly protein TadD